MGVCEGLPGSIRPDHLGRADYNGASVNQVGNGALSTRCTVDRVGLIHLSPTARLESLLLLSFLPRLPV